MARRKKRLKERKGIKMAKPIKFTDDIRAKIIENFTETIKNTRMSDGKISFTQTFKYEDKRRASVVFSSVAYAKMLMLVQHFSNEVAWHGVCVRDEEDPSTFRVSDILVYPQSVTGATVDMDQEKYGNWIADNIDDERFCYLNLQGHSHVRMGVTPSGTDINHQSEILSQLRKDGFYVFMIANKQGDIWFSIYDLRENCLYENADIDYYIGSDEISLADFLDEADGLVVSKYNYSYNKTGNTWNNKNTGTPTSGSQPWNVTNLHDKTASQPETKTKPKASVPGNYDDWYDEYYKQYGY